MGAATKNEAAVVPVVKWAGGKTRLLPELVKRLPDDYAQRRHIELFAGGAALMLHTRPARSVLVDRNEHLIELYRVLQGGDVAALKRSVVALTRHHGREHYYKVRARFVKGSGTRVQRAAMFLYLNRAGFNGLYRENKRGELNVPFGDVAQGSIYQPTALSGCAAALKGTSLMHSDFYAAAMFRELVGDGGDFLYLDPPYAPTCRTSFSSYVGSGFHHEDHFKVLELVREFDRRGAKVMISNADTFFVRDLFRDFRIDVVQGSRSISSKGDGRGRVPELLIRNYGN